MTRVTGPAPEPVSRLVSSWGRLSALPHRVVGLTGPAGVAAAMAAHRPGVCFGMGRSYGDACLNPGGVLWSTPGLGRFIAFDADAGLLTCEGGVLLRDVQRLFVPRGFMLPVTPGTQVVTVGGAIANDVHGKNHHRLGTFGDHVRGLRLVRSDGEMIDCGPGERPEWFAATVGGLGLTGIIAQAQIELRRVPGPWLEVETVPYASLDEFFRLSDDSEAAWEYTVSWIDCVAGAGRGIFMRANHADVGERPAPRPRERTVPFVPPLSLVNRLSLRPFNTGYFHLQKSRAGRAVTHYEPFFYPLDNLLEWNRLYGPRGFYQYQTATPRAVVPAMLKEIARSGSGSFLAVLKTFGERAAPGMLSFPRPGVTLALDFPNQGPRTLALFERLDAVVREAGGRIYPAKDARMPRALFEAGYPHLGRFQKFRDPGISSAMSRRLMGS